MINTLRMVKPNRQHHQDRALQIRSLVEFQYMIEPYTIDAIENLVSHYLHYHINISGLVTTLQRLQVYKFNLYINKQILRFSWIKFSVFYKLAFI